jgi:hypothetical protein
MLGSETTKGGLAPMHSRIAAPLAVALAGLSLAAPPALARGGGSGGGGGGGGTVTPAPAPDPVPFVDVCDGYWNLPPYPDGSLPVVNRTAGGCVIVRHSTTGVNTLDQVILVPGWTDTVIDNGGGTSSRVQVDFTNPTTGEKASIRVENGKTVIR